MLERNGAPTARVACYNARGDVLGHRASARQPVTVNGLTVEADTKAD